LQYLANPHVSAANFYIE